MATRRRCHLVYALAPEGVSARAANDLLNEYIGDMRRGVIVFHDHFTGKPHGGVAVWDVATDEQAALLDDPGPLGGWDLQVHPLTFALAANDLGFIRGLGMPRATGYETFILLHCVLLALVGQTVRSCVEFHQGQRTSGGMEERIASTLPPENRRMRALIFLASSTGLRSQHWRWWHWRSSPPPVNDICSGRMCMPRPCWRAITL